MPGRIDTSTKGAGKKLKIKKNCTLYYYFIEDKVVTHSGKVVYTTIRIYTH